MKQSEALNHAKPELLLPAGNRESFYAAIEAGADAVYLGLNMFNARQRASNFSIQNLPSLLYEARKNNIKVYITVNTLVKNGELFDVVRLLYQLEKYRVDAIIIQDWGVYHLLKTYFPSLKIHASTQMTVHNSVAVAFCAKTGFDRVILARELTMSEIERISLNAPIGLEVFIHGALCYSVSGCCLFSSFISGNSANRGLCVQPCRRPYIQDNETASYFSLKDNWQAMSVHTLAKLGITSFKVEGRLKSADYVYHVGKTYRRLMNEEISAEEAEQMLLKDFGREKCGYFLGGDVSEAFTTHTGTGLYVGKILKTENGKVALDTTTPVKKRNRILLEHATSQRQEIVKVESIQVTNEYVWIDVPFLVKDQSPVFLLSENNKHFPNKFPKTHDPPIPPLSNQKTERMLNCLIPWQEKTKNKEQYFIRINTLDQLRHLNITDFAGIILKFDSKLQFESSLHQLKHDDLSRFQVELPVFIGEKEMDFYKRLCRCYFNTGMKHFMLAHISQRLLLPEGALFSVNENCYVINDAAAAFFTRQQAACWIYPLENDLDNLLQGKDRRGMVNVYYCPPLFYSRTPEKHIKELPFTDESGKLYRKQRSNKMTVVTPTKHVCLFGYKKTLLRSGFSRFLIDVCNHQPEKQAIETLLQNLKASEPMPDTITFNFGRGLR